MVCISFNILLFNREVGWGIVYIFFMEFLLVGGGNFVVLWVEQFFCCTLLNNQNKLSDYET